MKNQQGAALVVVISLLSAGLTIGVMNMQTSQIDERLAGNYRAAALAQMAAEYGASERVAAGFDSSDEDCETLLREYDERSESFGQEPVGDTVDDNSDSQGFKVVYYYAECRVSYDGQDQNAYLILGQVRRKSVSAIDDFIAMHVLEIFEISGGSVLDLFDDADGNPLLSEAEIEVLTKNTLFSGGPEIRRGDSEVSGTPPMSNQGVAGVPATRDVVKRVREMYESNSPLVVSSCDENFVRGDAKIVFCDGDFIGDLDDSFSGMVLVADNNIGNPSGNQRVNVKSDVDVYLIAGGAFNFSGFGGNKITGGVWAGGDLNASGSANFCGSVVVGGAAEFSGSSSFDIGDGCLPYRGGGTYSQLGWRSL